MNAHISNLQDLSPKPTQIKLDKVRTIVFDMFALSKLEEIYGSQEEAFKAFGLGKVKDICNFLLAGLLHEDSELTIDKTMQMIGMGKLQILSDIIMTALNLDLPDPNVQTHQN